MMSGRQLVSLMCLIASSSFAAVRIDTETIPMSTPRGINPLPVRVPFTADGAVTVTTDAAWVTPSVDAAHNEIVLNFSAAALQVSANTATIRAQSGGATDSFYVDLAVTTPNITRLIDDPVRSRVYGLQPNGSGIGVLVIYEPINGTMVGSIPLGHNPTGFAISKDGSELFAINVGDKTISVVDLASLKLKETLGPLPFGTWSSDTGIAEVAVGNGDILYYTDTSWGPLMRVYNRATHSVLQALDIKGRSVSISSTSYNGDSGFGDFAVSPDGKSLYGWAQYGWSVGSASSFLAHFTIAADGRLALAESTTASYPTGLMRDPLNSPIFIDAAGTLVFTKEVAVSSSDVRDTRHSFPTTIRSVTPGGEFVATQSQVFDVLTGNPVFDLPVTAQVQTVTSDYARLVYFNGTTLKTINLIEVLGDGVPGQTFSPGNGAIVLPPEKLTWRLQYGAGSYRVYLGTSAAAVAAATPSSPEFLGEAHGISLDLQTPPAPGTTYFWRVDSVFPDEVVKGEIRSFTTSPISSSLATVETATLAGHDDVSVNIELNSSESGLAWSATSDQPWLTFSNAEGTTPAVLRAHLNAAHLEPGVYQAVIRVAAGESGTFEIPVIFTVAPLRVTLLKADSNSAKVYGISEDTTPTAHAYLFEFDSNAEKITRVIDVGTSVTDLAIHHEDGVLYVPNWEPGLLRAIDINTFQQVRSYAFKPFAGTGYGEGDVYRVTPAGPGRLVVEEEDQWIDIDLLDTATGATMATTFEREGGGVATASGRYYYHGDNNSSGAEIHRYDLVGGTFQELAHKRVESAGYYGSRVIVASEDGSRVFWNGSMFDAGLSELWTLGKHIYAVSPDGRLAFGDDRIYDTERRQAVLGMPATTTISAFSGMTRKLVTPVDGALRCDLIEDPYVMPAPEITGAVASSATAVTVRWSDHSLETGFTVQFRKAGTTDWATAGEPEANVTSLSVGSLLPDQAYEFRLKANAPSNSSEWSNIVSATTLGAPPIATYLVSANLASGNVVLTWSTSTTADRYRVERRIASGDWEFLAEVPAPTLTYTDTTVDAETSYSYRVTALRGGSESAPSNVRTVTLYLPPATPQNLEILFRKDGSAVVVWDAVSSAETYVLQRRPSSGGDWEEVSLIPGNLNLYLDMSGGAQFDYRVAARNAYGQSDFAEPIPDDENPTPNPRPTPKPRPHRKHGDRRAPVLRLNGPGVRSTQLSFMIVDGMASDDRKLRQVEYTASGFRVPVRAHGLDHWYVLVNLRPGRNTLTVRAEDAAGNKSRRMRVTIYREME